jgi:hypothetical protein
MSEASAVRFHSKASRKGEFMKIAERELLKYAADTTRVDRSEKVIEIHSLNAI